MGNKQGKTGKNWARYGLRSVKEEGTGGITWQTDLCKMLSSRFFPLSCSFVAAQLGEKLGPDRLVFANMGPMRPGDNAQMIEFFKPAANDIQQVRPQNA